jgi:hypothetical protein
VIHLYAVTATPPTELLTTGVEDAPPAVHAAGALHAVVSEHDRAPATTAANALAHARVVADVADRTPCLPVRFGTHHLDVAALRTALTEVESAALAALVEVGDGVEFVVRTDPAAPADPAPTDPVPAEPASDDAEVPPGRRYLESRLAEQRAAEASAAAVRERLAAATDPLVPLARSVTERVGRHGPERCFLVPRPEVERFEIEARAVTTRAELVLGGPWPPFTFAEEALR